MILLLDKNEELTRSIDCYSITRTRELNGENSIVVESNEEILEGDRIVFKDEQNIWNEYIISSVEIERDDEARYIAYGEDSSYELFNTYVDDLKPREELAKSIVERLLEDTRFKVGFIEDVGKISTNFYHTNVRNCLYRIVEKLGCEIDYRIEVKDSKIIARYVDLYRKIGSNNGKRFTYKKDLNNIKKTVDYSNICSKLYGYGKGEEIVDDDYDITTDNTERESKYGRRINFADVNGGKKYVENNDTRLKYGIGLERKHLENIFIAEDCEDKEELLKLTKEELEKRSKPKISYDINVEDISKYQDMGGIIEGVGLGDEVLISDKSINEKVLTRVIKIVDHPFTGEDMNITLGNYFIDLADNLAQIEKLRQLIERREKLLGEEIKRLATMTNKGFLRSVTDLLNKELNDTDGFIYFIPNKGIRIYNKPIDANPTKCIELGGGHFRIANKKLANGEFDFTTFGTGDGFTASLIVAGILKGGKVEFDLENGTFLIGESKEKYSMLWDGNVLRLRNVDIDLSNNYQIGEINNKIEDNTKTFNTSITNLDDKFNASVTGLDDKLTGLSTSVDTRFTEAAEDVDKKFTDFGSDFDTKISNIQGTIDSVQQDFKVGQGNFESSINTKIKDLTADVEVNFKDVNERIAGNVTGIGELSSQIKQTESSITQSVSNQIKAVNEKISNESKGIKTYVQDNYSTKIQTADKISNEIGSVKKLITDGDNSVKTYLQKNYSTTIQTNEKISSEVKSAKSYTDDKDRNIRNYISNNYSTTTQTSNMIQNKVSSYNSRLGSVESEITQTNNKIDSEIRSVKSTASSNYNSLSSRITQTANSISSKVSSSEARSIFRQEAKSFTFDADQVNFNSNVNIKGTFETRNYNSRIKLEDGTIKFWDESNGNYAGKLQAYNRGLRIESPEGFRVWAGKIAIHAGDDMNLSSQNKMNLHPYGGLYVNGSSNFKSYVTFHNSIYFDNSSGDWRILVTDNGQQLCIIAPNGKRWNFDKYSGFFSND